MSKAKKGTKDIVFQIHLTGFGHSERGVRLEQLDIDVVHEIEAEAARGMAKDDPSIVYRQEVLDAAVARMVVEITEEPIKGTREAEDGKRVPRTLQDPDVKWRKVTVQDMRQNRGGLFTAKDIAALERFYIALHELGPMPAEELLGKAVMVTMP